MRGWRGWKKESWIGWGGRIIVFTAKEAVKMPLRFYNKWINR